MTRYTRRTSGAAKVVDNQQPRMPDIPETHIHMVTADGVDVFYRETGAADAPILLLLHGYPSSSHMFRNLMPRLGYHYRLIAPDLPGFGFTGVPDSRKYRYTFEALTNTLSAFLDALKVERFALYVFDCGAPVGFRLALRFPDRVTTIISQNGNAYEEGLGEAWTPIQRYWEMPSAENREALRHEILTLAGTRWQYVHGASNPMAIAPESFTLDYALLERPGNQEIQLDLLLDYVTNIRLYPKFQAYFREAKPPMLAIWSRHDPFFLPAGAEAFRRDNPNVAVEYLDTGRFALETHVAEIAAATHRLLSRSVV